MNRSMIAALLSMTVVILTGSWSYAVSPPHDFRCDQCHTSQGSNPTMEQRSHACVGCHSNSGTAARMPFEPADMSNRFGSTANAPSGGSQSSHNWEVAAPYDPKAMVREPVTPALNQTAANKLNLTNYVGCIRCHDVKLASALNVTPGANKPLLRAPNTGDTLCMDCHQPRQVTSAQFGSHPVAYRPYSTVYKSNTTAFRRVPQNANPANSTSDLGRYLSNNQVVCSTCHGAHYADSSSATFGNRSTAAGYYNYTGARAVANRFAKSAGNLLRTDYRGAKVDDINTCSTCHKETAQKPHNNTKTKNQKMQCNDCHSAHVDYYVEGVGPNWKLVRRYMNVSTSYGAVRNGRAVFNGSTSMWYKKADGTGVCQACHVVPEGPNDQQAHKVANAKPANCSGCHNHTNGFTGDIQCTSCHGQPPVQNSFGGPFGMPAGYTGNDGTSPHSTHAAGGSNYSYGCVECHYSNIGAQHNNTPQTFQSVFIDATNSVGDKAGHKNTSADYNATSQTCSNVYCHSNGAPRGGTFVTKSPVWPGNKGSIVGQAGECTSCHEYGSTLTTNAHSRHVTDAGKACAICHSATVDSAGRITDKTKHANGTKDIAVVSPSLPGSLIASSFDTNTATCANACHQNITRDVNGNKVYSAPIRPAQWDDSQKGAAYCGSCHAAVPTTLAHPVHLTAVSGPKLGNAACTQCHPFTATGSGTTHVNGTVSVISQNTSCYGCHPIATSASWTQSSSVTCESCHVTTQSIVPNPGFKSYSAPMKNTFSVSGHGQANSANGNYDVSRQCTACHSANPTDAHIGGGPDAKRLKLTNDNGVCNSCHTTAAAKGLPDTKVDLPSHVGFTKYTSSASNVLLASKCTACHDVHGTTNNYMLKTTINGMSVTLTNISTGFIATEPGPDGMYHGVCQVCHTRTYVYRNSPAKFGSYSGLGAGHDRKWCLDCHKHKDPKATYAFQPVGGCNVCHGYPPAASVAGLNVQGNYSTAKLEDYAGGGGAHTVQGHLPKTLTATNGNGFGSCVTCHNTVSATHNGGGTPVKAQFVNVVVDTKYKFNKDQSITYNSLTGTCSNVSCHFQATPKWSPVKQ